MRICVDQHSSDITAITKLLVALSFRRKSCKILETTTRCSRSYKLDFLSSINHYVRPTTSWAAALSSTVSSHSATNCRRSPATRHDSPTAAGPATAADPSRSRQSWSDLRSIHQQAQATSFRKSPTSAANGATASPDSSRTTARRTPDAGAARAASSYHTGGTGSEGVGAGKVAEKPRSEAKDLYIEWATEGYVQRCSPPFHFSSMSPT